MLFSHNLSFLDIDWNNWLQHVTNINITIYWFYFIIVCYIVFDREEVGDENDSIKEAWIVEYDYYQINLDWKMHSLIH